MKKGFFLAVSVGQEPAGQGLDLALDGLRGSARPGHTRRSAIVNLITLASKRAGPRGVLDYVEEDNSDC